MGFYFAGGQISSNRDQESFHAIVNDPYSDCWKSAFGQDWRYTVDVSGKLFKKHSYTKALKKNVKLLTKTRLSILKE